MEKENLDELIEESLKATGEVGEKLGMFFIEALGKADHASQQISFLMAVFDLTVVTAARILEVNKDTIPDGFRNLIKALIISKGLVQIEEEKLAKEYSIKYADLEKRIEKKYKENRSKK